MLFFYSFPRILFLPRAETSRGHVSPPLLQKGGWVVRGHGQAPVPRLRFIVLIRVAFVNAVRHFVLVFKTVLFKFYFSFYSISETE